MDRLFGSQGRIPRCEARSGAGKAQSSEKAIEELKKCAGSQFDPKVVEAFIYVWKEQFQKQEELDREKEEKGSSVHGI